MRRVPLLLLAMSLALAACGGDTSGTTTTSTTAATTTTTTPSTTTVATSTTSADTTTTQAPEPTLPTAPYLTIGDSSEGPVVVDHDGMTVYLFMNDERGPSTCAGACAVTWPPLVGDLVAGPGVDADLIGFVERADGTSQLTYVGWPLYYYVGDLQPGQTMGQGIGTVWWMIDSDGDPVE